MKSFIGVFAFNLNAYRRLKSAGM